VSEGIVTPDGKTWAQKMAEGMSEHIERDSHGNIQLSGTGALGDFLADLIKDKLTPAGGKKLRVRADTFGYLQRSFPGFVSETDAREARLVGEKAVEYSRTEGTSGSVAMRRVGTGDYRVETFLTPLETVARETKHMDPAHIVNGNDVSDAFKAYAAPLVGPLPRVGTFDELK
jgi:6-phosphofructokinase 1